MSNERQETIKDIVSEMRIGDLCAGDTAARSMYINDFLASYADRIEAAAKREREANREKSSQVGNAAKMREALEVAEYVLCAKGLFDDSKQMAAALSTPPRNCDRPECATTKAAQDIWRKEDGGKTAYYEWLLATSTKGETK